MIGMRRSALLLLILSAKLLHAADADVVAKPATWDVVVGFAEHRFLTSTFQQQVREEIGDRLRTALGDAVEVTVRGSDPLLPQVLARGLGTLDRLDRLEDRHRAYVIVRFHEGRYELDARHFAGPAAFAVPSADPTFTADRRDVARLASQSLLNGFSPVGIVDAKGSPSVLLEGGKLGLDARVRPGDAFAVVQVQQDGPNQRAVRMPWVLLEAIGSPRDGVASCKVWRRFAEDDLKPRPGIVRYVAVRLPARKELLRLRFVEESRERPLAGLTLEVQSGGSGMKQELVTDRDGMATTDKAIDRFAVVRVLQGSQVRTQFPVALLDEYPVTVPLSARPEQDELVGLEFRRDLWIRRVIDDLAQSADRVAELNRLLGKSLDEALGASKSSLRWLDDRLTMHSEERSHLTKAAKERNVAEAALKLGPAESALGDLRKRREQLADFVGRLEKAVEQSQNEQTKAIAQQVERAKLLESQGDAVEAIRALEAALKVRDEGSVRAHLERLRKQWEPISPAHSDARTFLLQTWPRVEPQELPKKLDEARRALSIVREAGDTLTLTKLRFVDASLAVQIKKRLDAVRSRADDEARAESRMLRDAAENLGRFHSQVLAAGKKD
jgi:tetratricopeptide (TPR) repeat protein